MTQKDGLSVFVNKHLIHLHVQTRFPIRQLSRRPRKGVLQEGAEWIAPNWTPIHSIHLRHDSHDLFASYRSLSSHIHNQRDSPFRSTVTSPSRIHLESKFHNRIARIRFNAMLTQASDQPLSFRFRL